MSKPWKPGFQESDLRDHSPSYPYPRSGRGNMEREPPSSPGHGRVHNQHADMMPGLESRGNRQFEGGMSPRLGNSHMPRHRAPGPTGTKHPRSGMRDNSSFLHPATRDQHIGMGKGKASPEEYMDNRRSGLRNYLPKDKLRSKSRLDGQSPEEEYDSGSLTSGEESEAATVTSNDSDGPPPQDLEQPQIQVQDDFSTRPIHDPRERNAMRAPLKRPNLAYLSRPGGQYSRHTTTGLPGNYRMKQHQHGSEFRAARTRKGPSSAC